MTILPIAMKIAAKTIGVDLVAVKPMGVPVGRFLFFDLKDVERRREKLRKAMSEWRKHAINEIMGEQD
jgi:hypothetical protein